MAKLESLIVDMKLETAELKKGIDAANAKIKSLSDQVKKLSGTMNMSAVAGVVKDATKALVGFVMQGAQTADGMGKMAASAGISVEEFSRLAYAAQLGGINSEEFAGVLNKLNKNLGEAAAGGKEQAAIFKGLGISIKDSAGNAKGTDVIFKEIADKLDNLGPGYDKAKLEMDLFGKSGAKLESMLAGGSKAINELGKEADKLGITISSSTAQSSQEFNDNMEKLELTFSRVGAQVAGEVAPAFTRLSDFLLKTNDGAAILKTTVKVLSTLMKVLASVVIGLGAAFDVVGTALAGVAAQFVELFKGNFKGAAEIGNAMAADIKKSIATATDLLSKTWEEPGKKADESAKKTKESAAKINKSIDSIKKNLAELRAQAAFELRMKVGEIDRDAATQRKDFSNIGKNPTAILQEAAKDFTSYTHALGVQTEYLVSAEAKASQAALVRAKDPELARNLTETATRFRLTAEAAGVAKDALFQLALIADQQKEEQKSSDFELSRSSKDIDRNTNQRIKDFSHRDDSPRQKLQDRIGGFKSFDQALQEAARSTKMQNEFIAKARALEAKGMHDAAREQMAFADAVALDAEKATDAAAALEELSDLDAAEAQAKLDKIMGGLAAVGLQFVSKLGELGSVIQAGIQGFESGGVWGAIIAVVIELLSKFERFQEVMDIATGQLEIALSDMKSGFNSLIDGIKPLMGAIGMIAEAVHGILNPILELIGDVLGGLAPIFAILGVVMKPLGALFKSIASVLGAVLIPILNILAYVFIGIGLVMMGLQIAVSAVWLALVTAADEILKKFGSNALSQARNEANQALQDNIHQAEELSKTDPKKLMDMANASAENAEKIGEEKRLREENNKKIDKTSKALDRLSAQFTNVPDGFKLNYRTFNAQDAQGGPTSLGYGGGNNIIVMGTLVTEREVQTYISSGQAKRNWQRNGSWK